ncbi:hypothetical protein GTY65_00490 [Streptomyces sp. SID8379]|uniref:HIT domain-containing protein n=1 Tax=unclassified Streptomyces TaxID=2593676 RepID=UPI00131A015D|nr:MULTISPECIES: hypothetical protein [unclassified Streptomyces]MYW62564.1 hypothetical protein [Streptomyces sp. SID8379]
MIATGSPTPEYVELARCTTFRPVRQHWLVDGHLLLAEVAPLSAGHVLVIPGLHILATARLPSTETIRFRQICRKVGLRLTERFSRDSYLTFEHGTGRTGAALPQRVKCAPTEHAHVHVLPNLIGSEVLDLLDGYTRADGYAGSQFDPADWASRRAALEAHGSSYHSFTLGTRDGERGMLFQPPGGALPSQYFRRFVAQCAQGSSEEFSLRCDWRDEVVFADDAVLHDIAATALFLEAGEWQERPSSLGSHDAARQSEKNRTSTLTPTHGHE